MDNLYNITPGESATSRHTGITYTVEEVFEDIVVLSHDKPIISPIGGIVIEPNDPVEVTKPEWDAIKSNI